MRKARNKVKAGKGTAAKSSTGRKAGGRCITRAEARRRAARHVLKRMFQGATVRDWAEAGLVLGYVAWPSARRSSKEAWVVYKNLNDPGALKSSDVVLVCKRTGRVLYEGPAGDEG